MSGAMNLTEEQRDALSTLAVRSAVVRLADEHPEAFLVKVPRCPIQEGSVSDAAIREHMAAYYGVSTADKADCTQATVFPVVPPPDKKNEND